MLHSRYDSPARDRMLDRLLDTLLRRPVVTLLVVAVAAGGAAYWASGLEVRASYLELLPSDLREVRDLKDVAAAAGGTAWQVAAVGGGTEDARRDFADRLAAAFEGRPGVHLARAKFPRAWLEDRRLWFLPVPVLETLTERVEEETAILWARAAGTAVTDEEPDFADIERDLGAGLTNQLYGDYARSDDGRYLFVFIKPAAAASEPGAAGALFDDLTATVGALRPEDHGLHVKFAGNLSTMREQQRVITGDFGRAGTLSLVLTIALLWLATRRFWSIAAVGVPLLAGIACTLAFARASVGGLNIISGFLVAVLIGLGIDFGIHLYFRFADRRTRGETKHEAARGAVHDTFTASLTSALTTAAAFLTIAAADFKGFSEYGGIAAAGVMITFAGANLAFPPLAVLLPHRPGIAPPDALNDRPAARPAYIAMILVVVAGFSLFALSSAGDVRFYNNFREIKGESPATDFYEYVEHSLGGSLSPAVFRVKNLAEAQAVESAVAAAKAGVNPAGDASGFHRALSLLDLLPRHAEERAPLFERIRRAVERLPSNRLTADEKRRKDELIALTRVPEWTLDAVPDVLKRPFEAKAGGDSFVLAWPRYMLYDEHELRLWASELKAVRDRVEAQTGLAVQVLDENMIMAAVLNLIDVDAPFIVIGCGLVVFLLIWLDLRQLGAALLVFSPLLVGVLALYGTMRLAGMHFNLFNMVAVPALLGIGVDNSVHLYHHWREARAEGLARVMQTTGLAGLVASLTTAAGFGACMIAHHRGIYSLGLTAMLGTLALFVSGTVFFPSLLLALSRNGQPSK